MHFLYIVLFCSGILGVESFYNCTADQYMQNRVRDCKYIFENGYDASDCSAAKILADNLDTCIQTALLGCDHYFVLLFEYDYSRDIIWDTAETTCSGSGHFNEPGEACFEMSQAASDVFDCIDAYVPVYDGLDINSPDFCRWPGSTHDSRILRESELYQMYSQHGLQGFLLGDSGYTCLRWLLTPVNNPSTEAERYFNSDFRGALDNYKSCIDTASAGCTHDSRNYLVTGSAYYTDELQYLEACTVPSDPSFNCDTDVDTTGCWATFEAENATITPLFPEDYCFELISAVDNYRTCVYNATMLLGCRSKFDEAMDAFTFAADISDTCGGTICYGNQQLTTLISTTCISDLGNHRTTFNSSAKDEASCLLFRSQISDARNCIKEANAAAGCLFNSLSPFSEVTNANVDYSTACGFNNDTCSRKLEECQAIASDTDTAITSNAGCSVTYGHFDDLDFCIIEAATIGQCISSELDDIKQQEFALFNNLPNCPSEAVCTTVPFLAIDAYCVDPLWYNIEALADNLAIDHPDFCTFFEEEIAETHTCVKTNLDAVGCDTSRANELTASYDYLHNITCRNQYAQNLGTCTKPSEVLYGISICAYGLNDEITDVSNTIDFSNMETKCSLIDDMLNSTNWCLFEVLEEQNCEAQLNGLYNIIEEHAFPNPDVCMATTTTPPQSTTTPPSTTTEEVTSTEEQNTNSNNNNNNNNNNNSNNQSAGSSISIQAAMVCLTSVLAYMTTFSI